MLRNVLYRLVLLTIMSGVLNSLAAAADLKIAVVDIDAVSARYKDLNDRQAELGAWVQDRKAYVNVMQDFMFVSAEEFQEASRIYNVPKAQWSAEQTKREGELREVSANNEKKFVDLQAVASRTPEQQNQFSTLRDTFQARDRDLKTITAEFDKQLKERRDAVTGKLVGNVRGVIEKVSKEKGYTLVLDKSAVYFSAAPIDDVTEEVLKALNAGVVAPGAPDAKPDQPQ